MKIYTYGYDFETKEIRKDSVEAKENADYGDFVIFDENKVIVGIVATSTESTEEARGYFAGYLLRLHSYISEAHLAYEVESEELL